MTKPLSTDQILLQANEQQLNHNIYQLKGSATLHNQSFKLQAKQIKFNQKHHTLQADGNIKITYPQLVLTAGKLSASHLNTTPTVQIQQAQYRSTQNFFSGQAESALSQNQSYQFNQALFSTCPEIKGQTYKIWQMKSATLNLDFNTNRGNAKGVILEILGYPVLYLPHYRWVLSGRSSGFLTPKLSRYTTQNNLSGYDIQIPYYFNLSKHKDLELSLDYLSKIGYGLQTTYRHLFKESNIKLTTRYFPNDKLLNKKRWLFNSNNQFALSDNAKLKAIIHRVSDPEYFNDIEHNNYTNQTLNSLIEFNYQTPDILFNISHDEQQLINSTPSYVRQPEIQLTHTKKALLGEFDTLFNMTQFNHQNSQKISGLRSHIQSKYKRKIDIKNGEIYPEFNLYHTIYDLDNTQEERSIINANVDTTWHFMRLLNQKIIHHISPRIFYNWTQNKPQSHLPNFDSNRLTQHYQSLFNSRAFSGYDRYISANQITIGLSNEFYDKHKPTTLVSVNLAQTLYQRKQHNPFNLDSKKSNLILETSVIKPNSTFNINLQYDTHKNQLVQQLYQLTHQINNNHQVAIDYQKNQPYGLNLDEQHFVGLTFNKKINRYNQISLGTQYDLENDRINEQNIEFKYQNCCFSIRLSQHKSYGNNQSYNYQTKLNFDLIGLTK